MFRNKIKDKHREKNTYTYSWEHETDVIARKVTSCLHTASTLVKVFSYRNYSCQV
jgi:hypothetical protein